MVQNIWGSGSGPAGFSAFFRNGLEWCPWPLGLSFGAQGRPGLLFGGIRLGIIIRLGIFSNVFIILPALQLPIRMISNLTLPSVAPAVKLLETPALALASAPALP